MSGSSAEKQARSSEKKHLGNKSTKTTVKTKIATAEKLISSGEPETAKKAVVDAIAALDRAAGRGILHSNNSSRRKSRLMRKLNLALTPAESTPKEAK